jgi:hypothetical protein
VFGLLMILAGIDDPKTDHSYADFNLSWRNDLGAIGGA